MLELLYLPPVLGVVGLVIAFVIYGVVNKYPAGGENITKIGDAIHLGAMVFMHREYKMLAMFSAVLVGALSLSLGKDTTIAFIAGAVSLTSLAKSQ